MWYFLFSIYASGIFQQNNVTYHRESIENALLREIWSENPELPPELFDQNK